MVAKLRAGDTVLHGPTGETWTLVLDERDGYVRPGGWPPTRAEASACHLVRAATDTERRAMLMRVKQSTLPVWMVWNHEEDSEDDHRKIYAHGAEGAAEIWAGLKDGEGDYYIVKGDDATVMVRSASGEVTKWVVRGESNPTYSAREVIMVADEGGQDG